MVRFLFDRLCHDSRPLIIVHVDLFSVCLGCSFFPGLLLGQSLGLSDQSGLPLLPQDLLLLLPLLLLWTMIRGLLSWQSRSKRNRTMSMSAVTNPLSRLWTHPRIIPPSHRRTIRPRPRNRIRSIRLIKSQQLQSGRTKCLSLGLTYRFLYPL
jgi:hypothetical protein